MSWNEVTLAGISAAGMVTLLLTLLREILLKLPEVIQAWRAVRRALRTPSSDSDEHVA